jgi:mercuric ion binding protein
MKSIIRNFFLVFSIISFSFSACNAQTKGKNQTIKFKVWGNCEMCQKTIETSLDVKGVKSASWSTETNMINVVFNPEKITEDKLHELIAASGYDTDKKKGDDGVYKKLPDCCQYTRKK